MVEKEKNNNDDGIKMDFSDKKAKFDNNSPFKKAEDVQRRLKLFLWGESGSGKTTLALQFPKPAVIDLEKGTELYAKDFSFDVMRCSSADEVMAAIDWLRETDHNFSTLIIDPITIYWESLQKKWSDIFLLRNKKSKGYKFEYYDLQVRDWQTVKAEFKEFIRKIIELDMNVIITARSRTQYADGEFMRAIGDTFDGEKSLPYLFDTIIHMHQDDKGKFWGHCLKDRTNNLPPEFEISYDLFQKLFDEKDLKRKAKKVNSEKISKENLNKIKMFIKAAHDGGCKTVKIDAVLKSHGVDLKTLDNLTETKYEEVLDLVIALKNAYVKTF